MKKRFSEYAYVVLDATFFKSLFSRELRDELQQVKIFMPSTFPVEMAHYRSMLSREKKRILEENYRFVHALQRDEKRFRHGLWETIKELDGKNALVLTANRLMIQRVVLRCLDVDIYDTEKQLLIPSSDFSELKSSLEFDPKTDEYPDEADLPQELTLYTTGGMETKLSSTAMQGVEAQIYAVDGLPDLVAKVFYASPVQTEKIRNVEHMHNVGMSLDCTWLLYPERILYWDRDCKKLAGFLQTYKSEAVSLTSPLYAGNPLDPACNLNVPISDTLKLCLRLTRQIQLLNTYGECIFDYNTDNFALDRKKPDFVFMWDVDSFCSREYPPYAGGDETTARDYDLASFGEVIACCDELLFIFIFKLLTLGFPAVHYGKRSFMGNEMTGMWQWRRDIVPTNLMNLFERVFDPYDPLEPGVDMLLYELHVALNDTTGASWKDLTYQQVYERSLAGGAENQNEKQEDESDSQIQPEELSCLSSRALLMRARLPQMLSGPSARTEQLAIPVTMTHYRRYPNRPLCHRKPSALSFRTRRRLAAVLQLIGGLTVVFCGVSVVKFLLQDLDWRRLTQDAWEGLQALIQRFRQ